jgi:transposase-like protein
MPSYKEILCPECQSNHITRSGRNEHGEQRYRCQETDCQTKTFMLSYRYRACEPGIKEQIIDMAINGSGIRDTGRVLKINKNTVIKTLKKRATT